MAHRSRRLPQQTHPAAFRPGRTQDHGQGPDRALRPGRRAKGRRLPRLRRHAVLPVEPDQESRERGQRRLELRRPDPVREQQHGSEVQHHHLDDRLYPRPVEGQVHRQEDRPVRFAARRLDRPASAARPQQRQPPRPEPAARPLAAGQHGLGDLELHLGSLEAGRDSLLDPRAGHDLPPDPRPARRPRRHPAARVRFQLLLSPGVPDHRPAGRDVRRWRRSHDLARLRLRHDWIDRVHGQPQRREPSRRLLHRGARSREPHAKAAGNTARRDRGGRCHLARPHLGRRRGRNRGRHPVLLVRPRQGREDPPL